MSYERCPNCGQSILNDCMRRVTKHIFLCLRRIKPMKVKA